MPVDVWANQFNPSRPDIKTILMVNTLGDAQSTPGDSSCPVIELKEME